ncbi:uncharacterized protein LOC132604576 [Lycium barbarum]|uniref:uncharacterized protein LOC132604576 n=1 Tax=Lycium barbarum TaxID=112863 RepID=UPI00293ECD0B|nr:uncharacterized protein LOC132604576 [Lycium barbarum]XP_060174121.1 uncharacterized protein LOC132604576 [Lycium barbarum]
MARHPLEGFEVTYEVQRLSRESAFSFKREIRESTNIDEDYAHFLMLSLDYHKESTNEGGNEGSTVVRDKLNNDVREYEHENEDEDDPDYKKFLANSKPKGNSYELKIDRSDGFPLCVDNEKEDGSDEEYGHLGEEKQLDAGDEKDSDKVENQPFSRAVLENDNDIEPFGPVTHKGKGLANGALKRHCKGEAADVDEDYALLWEKRQSSS